MKRYKYVVEVVEKYVDEIENKINSYSYIQKGYRVVSISYMWNTTADKAKFLVTFEKPETDG